MHISLTPELENAVKTKVASGLYNNASEVVREALRQSLMRERENAWLAREAAIGLAQLEAGQTVTVESKQEFMALIREADPDCRMTAGRADVPVGTSPRTHPKS